MHKRRACLWACLNGGNTALIRLMWSAHVAQRLHHATRFMLSSLITFHTTRSNKMTLSHGRFVQVMPSQARLVVAHSVYKRLCSAYPASMQRTETCTAPVFTKCSAVLQCSLSHLCSRQQCFGATTSDAVHGRLLPLLQVWPVKKGGRNLTDACHCQMWTTRVRLFFFSWAK